MVYFGCDHEKKDGSKCDKRPYAELLFPTTDEEDGYWVYACRWHTLIHKLRRIRGKEAFGWCKVDTDREAIEGLKEEIWSVQSDLMDIKEKLGIEDSETEELKKRIELT